MCSSTQSPVICDTFIALNMRLHAVILRPCGPKQDSTPYIYLSNVMEPSHDAISNLSEKKTYMCQGINSFYIKGDGHPTLNG